MQISHESSCYETTQCKWKLSGHKTNVDLYKYRCHRYICVDIYMWHTWTCDTQNIFRELNMCNQPISRICGKPDLLSMQTWGNTLGLQVIDDVYCLKFPPYVFVPHVMWIRLNNKLWGLVKAPNSNIQVLVYVLFTVISMLAKVLGLTRSRTRWQALTLKSFY